jgi:cation-transporting ATPase 13A3/4/5
MLKLPLPLNNQEYQPMEEGKQYTLFSGTQCLETKLAEKGKVPLLALVT